MARSKLEGMSWWSSGVLTAATAIIAAKLFRYHPERHYMRGPGPKTLEKIGEELRLRMDATTKEALPEEWLNLLRALETPKMKSTNLDAQPRASRTSVRWPRRPTEPDAGSGKQV